MKRIFLETRTIFAELQTVGVRSFVFRGRVVAISRFRASQRDDHSHYAHLLRSYLIVIITHIESIAPKDRSVNV